MSIRISTSEYNKAKKVIIDDIEFSIRPMSSAESLAIIAISQDLRELSKDGDPGKVVDVEESMATLKRIYFSLYDRPDEAKKLLETLSIEDWFSIYEKVIKE